LVAGDSSSRAMGFFQPKFFLSPAEFLPLCAPHLFRRGFGFAGLSGMGEDAALLPSLFFHSFSYSVVVVSLKFETPKEREESPIPSPPPPPHILPLLSTSPPPLACEGPHRGPCLSFRTSFPPQKKGNRYPSPEKISQRFQNHPPRMIRTSVSPSPLHDQAFPFFENDALPAKSPPLVPPLFDSCPFFFHIMNRHLPFKCCSSPDHTSSINHPPPFSQSFKLRLLKFFLTPI